MRLAGTINEEASGLELDGLGSNLTGGEVWCAVQTGPEAHPAFCTMSTGFLSRRQNSRNLVLTTHISFTLVCEWVGAILLSHLCACIGRTLLFYLSGPYTASIIVQYLQLQGNIVRIRVKLKGFAIYCVSQRRFEIYCAVPKILSRLCG
jgi:hypothetical protein